jgi:hypothetical protein
MDPVKQGLINEIHSYYLRRNEDAPMGLPTMDVAKLRKFKESLMGPRTSA